MHPTADERRLRAQVNAHKKWAQITDRSAATAPARAALMQKFLDQCDGDPVRAEHARKAFYKAMALKSAIARRKAKEAIAAAEAAEAELAEAGEVA